jgi:predicted GNAT family N-acyltransferase
VFVDEQGVGQALEFDGRDEQAQHLLALRDGAAVGTLRVRWLGGRSAKIERVAMLAGARGSKIGRALLQAAFALAGSAGAETASLHAQTAAQGFYARLGFVAFGPAFMEDGIPHIAMRLSLPAGAVRERRPDRSATSSEPSLAQAWDLHENVCRALTAA